MGCHAVPDKIILGSKTFQTQGWILSNINKTRCLPKERKDVGRKNGLYVKWRAFSAKKIGEKFVHNAKIFNSNLELSYVETARTRGRQLS